MTATRNTARRPQLRLGAVIRRRGCADGRGRRARSAGGQGRSWCCSSPSRRWCSSGIVMTLSASAVVSINESNSAFSLFQRQLMWTGLGSVALLVTMRLDYHRLRPLAAPAIAGSVVLLLLVLVPGVGIDVLGARRWIGVGPLSFQPSELAKLAIVLFAADLLSRPSRDIRDTRATFRPVVAVTVLLIALLMAEPHLGNALVIASAVFVMLFLAGASLLHLGGLGLAGALGVAASIVGTSWRRERFRVFLDPWRDAEVLGYQSLQSLHAITVGGLTGVGLGESRAKWGFLPFAHSDFIFAIIAEELGFIGALFVVGLFATFGFAGAAVALRAPDRFGMLLALGITTTVVVQAFLNLGSVTNLLPVVGVTLPFLSVGGTSLVVTLAGVGVLLNIARQGR
ncbi:MAG: putative lipid II flippase FtsW [Acidimicrobiales bacterium]